MNKEIEKKAFEIADELTRIRHALHRSPEIGKSEFKTSALIKSELEKRGIPYESMAGTGIKAVIRGGGSAAVLLRADIDALPIREESGAEYASETDGVMHACGHDVHTACLIGAAEILNGLKDKLKGSVVLAFEPDEEVDGGARRMIDEGVMDNPKVTAAFALHVEPLEKTGFLQIKDGPVMASPDDFEIIVRGAGGHGAYPEKCVNPIEIGAGIVRRFKEEIKNDPERLAVSICSFNGGSCRNAIPDTAVLTGTARSLDEETRRELRERLEYIVKDTAAKMGGDAEFNFNVLFPPVVNDKKMNETVIKAAAGLECVKGVTRLERASMAGDDFSYFSRLVPGAYFKLGVGNEEIGAVYPIHSPRFKADDKALPIGAAVMALTAAEYLNGE